MTTNIGNLYRLKRPALFRTDSDGEIVFWAEPDTVLLLTNVTKKPAGASLYEFVEGNKIIYFFHSSQKKGPPKRFFELYE